MRLSKTKFWSLITISIFLGFIAQKIFVSDASRNAGFYNSYLGFTLLIPLFVAIFIGFLNLTKLKNKFGVTILGAILFVIIGMVNMILYPIFGGPTSEMYGLIIIFVVPPAFIIGILYGLYIAFNLDK